MSAVLKIVDEQMGKGRGPVFELHLASERTTARELIHRRIADEIDHLEKMHLRTRAEHDKARSFLTRLGTDDIEALLNPPRLPRKLRKKPVYDLGAETEAAFDAFEKNQFFMLFDDRQIDDLDAEITLTPASEVVFLRLTPLVGG